MTDKRLAELYTEHQGKVSDKWSTYLSEYDRIFQDHRHRPINLLEIGIQNGGSLEIWSRFFSHAKTLVGCDINPDCARLKYEDPRIAVVVGDANTDPVQASVRAHAPAFDIVIDDGSHRSSDIVKSFARYFPLLADGGVFVAEDLHCSYWQEFEGGLFDPLSSMAFFKRLADVLNHEHWGVEKSRLELLQGIFSTYGVLMEEEVLGHVHSVEFINSICVVRKADPERNRIGRRFVAGSFADVAGQIPQLHASAGSALPQEANPWALRELQPDEELLVRHQELGTTRGRVASLSQELFHRNEELAVGRLRIANLSQELSEAGKRVANLDQRVAASEVRISGLLHEVALLRHSRSWRITRPLRWMGRQARRVKRVASLVLARLRAEEGLAQTLKKAGRLYRSEGLPGIRRRLRSVEEAARPNPANGSGAFDRNDYTEWIRRYDTLTEETRATYRAKIQTFAEKPKISVVMPTYNAKIEWLIAAIESVRNQIYPVWELCIADDASTDSRIRPILERYAHGDARIKMVFRESNGHISAASNSALELVTGKWVALLDHDDLLAEHALFWVAEAINRQPGARLIYSDEDKIDDTGKRFDPYFKCDWNPELFLSQNMVCHLGIYEKALLDQVGGFRTGFEGAQDYDLALRCVEQIDAKAICHIPRVLYHWRAHSESTAAGEQAKPYAMLAGERALNEHLQRLGVQGRVELVQNGFRTHYELPDPPPLVSLIIPTRNGLALIKQCIDSIVTKTSYPNYEIIVVDNGSDDPLALAYFESLSACENIRVIRDARPFNYSRLNNAAVAKARGTIIGLINNDIEVIAPNWLSEMVGHVVRPEVGAVGAKLFYPTGGLQHGGVVVGVGGVAGHSHKHLGADSPGYFSRTLLCSSFSAVTAACLLVRKSVYEDVGGLNEKDLTIAFNDVDFCLRVRGAGYRNVWTPYAELYHHESVTRGYEDTPEKQARFAREVAYMKQRWGDSLLNDPAYSPNLTLDHEDFSLAWPPRVELF